MPHQAPGPEVHEPFISADTTLPELSVKAIVLGVILAAILGAANAYLGLKMGQTISACIPAAVLSMAILRRFKTSNILENNIVQTIASAGEVIAAAAIFTLPALLIMEHWTCFSYGETTLLTVLGGVIGVLFSIPLRRAMIVEQNLVFPEGVATAEVLKAGEAGGNAKALIKGGFWAALIQFGQGGLQLLGGSLNGWFFTHGTVVGFGTGLSGVMIAAGYIVGLQVAFSMFLGAVLMYGFSIPIAGSILGIPEGTTAIDAAMALKGQLRYIGVGAMVVGGISSLLLVMKPIYSAISKSIEAFRNRKDGSSANLPRTERDIPMVYVLGGICLLMIPVYFVLNDIFSSLNLPISKTTYGFNIILALLGTFVVGFLVSAIGSYMTGLVGSSSCPISGILMSSILLISVLLLVNMDRDINFAENTQAAMGVGAAIIMIAAIIACIASISGDNLQDLKSGHILGATPWKQQVGLLIGVLASALVIAPTLQVLFEAYGMGGVCPREGMDLSKNLAAPQAMLMATVAKGVIGRNVPIDLLMIGGAISFVVFLIDMQLKKRGKRLPALGVALGLYLPLDVTIPFFIGGLIHYMAAKARGNNKQAENQSVLLASGIIAGEALMGVCLAIPFAAAQSTAIFRFVPDFLEPYSNLLGFGAVGALCLYLYRVGANKQKIT